MSVTDPLSLNQKEVLKIKRMTHNPHWPYLDTSVSNVAIMEASPISKELLREYHRTLESY